jgi:hypothetical protein
VGIRTAIWGAMIGVHRPGLVDISAEAVGPAHLHLNQYSSSVERTASEVRAHLTNGATAAGNVLVGADGTSFAVAGRDVGYWTTSRPLRAEGIRRQVQSFEGSLQSISRRRLHSDSLPAARADPPGDPLTISFEL